ncbi:MAG: ribosome biogenesis GTPase YlqF [Prochlorococcus sp. SP3034]|nr:ribosome biogenesis GTPase YlqF [Prochlorococcus sp. SP3034]
MEIPKIQWYPGHIAKAEKKLSEIINRVDLIIEVRDARIPISTGHRHLNKWIIDKKHLLVINRSDMISNSTMDAWTKWFQSKQINPLWCDSKKGIGIKEVITSATTLRASIDNRRLTRGMRIRPIRAVTLGFPNVGKSALINRIANKKVVDSARKAGVTRNLRWVRFSSGLDLLDAPGVIPPDLEDQRAALNLAICDDIGEAAYELESVAIEFIKIMSKLYRHKTSNIPIKKISQRYGIDLLRGFQNPDEWIIDAAKKHTSGDKRRMANKLLEDFRNQMLGNFSLEVP